MTDETITRVLQRLNRNNASDVIIARIGDNVWWGFVYGETPSGHFSSPCEIQEEGDEFFFVKAKDGKFAGAVYWMGPDEMHWFVAEPYRGRRLLLDPLKKSILPFVFARDPNRPTQRCSVDLQRPCAAHSLRLAKRSGFKSVESSEERIVFEVSRNSVPRYKLRKQPKSPPSETVRISRLIRLSFRAIHMALDGYRVGSGAHLDCREVLEAKQSLRNARLDVLSCLESRESKNR